MHTTGRSIDRLMDSGAVHAAHAFGLLMKPASPFWPVNPSRDTSEHRTHLGGCHGQRHLRPQRPHLCVSVCVDRGDRHACSIIDAGGAGWAGLEGHARGVPPISYLGVGVLEVVDQLGQRLEPLHLHRRAAHCCLLVAVPSWLWVWLWGWVVWRGIRERQESAGHRSYPRCRSRRRRLDWRPPTDLLERSPLGGAFQGTLIGRRRWPLIGRTTRDRF